VSAKKHPLRAEEEMCERIRGKARYSQEAVFYNKAIFQGLALLLVIFKRTLTI
jgi:hypothetical protein